METSDDFFDKRKKRKDCRVSKIFRKQIISHIDYLSKSTRMLNLLEVGVESPEKSEVFGTIGEKIGFRGGLKSGFSHGIKVKISEKNRKKNNEKQLNNTKIFDSGQQNVGKNKYLIDS